VLKRGIGVEALSQSAKTLRPPHKCGSSHHERMAGEFQLVAGHLALDFANTLDYRYDPDRLIDLLPSYERFLAFCRQSGITTAAQMSKLLDGLSAPGRQRVLKEVIGFREALYSLILSAVHDRRPDESHLRTLNGFLSEARAVDEIVWHKRRFVRSLHDVTEQPHGPLRQVVDAAVALITSSDICNVRECSEKTCRWFFLDRSRNHSRRWCDMQLCGNRSKAKRFYARSRNDT
jgi:predicted RNA-binding Zn ribbon-like protein